MDQPESGKVYALTGGPSIANGNTWAESEVHCAGRYSDTEGRYVRHGEGLARLLGCTTYRCATAREE